jgi:hypothetical protein
LKDARAFRPMTTRPEPDLAIIGCTVSDPYAAPGSMVTASVELENLGFVSTPLLENGDSAVGIRVTLLGDDGRERVVRTEPVPKMAPGESRRIEIQGEVPHEPVKVRLDLNPDPVDRDLTNNTFEFALGTPRPADLSCHALVLRDVARRLVVQITWSNPLPYEEILLYRDGSMITSLPGVTTSFVDLHAAAGPHTYAVRGRIGVSKSTRASCTFDLQLPLEPTFRRGDVDGRQSIEITDAIALLGYLFLGSRAPECPDAADVDDTGTLEITDAIRLLGYLFLGSAPPPAPGALRCGPDPTEDQLGVCAYTCQD